MGKMKYDISVSGILRALYSVPIFRSVALSTNLFFVLGTVRKEIRIDYVDFVSSVGINLSLHMGLTFEENTFT